MVGQIYDDLTPSIVRRLHGERRDRRKEVEEDIRKVTRERDNLAKAVAHGGDIEALVSALREKEHRLSALERERAAAPVVQVERTLDLREQLLGDLATARAAVRELVGEITLEAEPAPAWLVHYVASPTGVVRKARGCMRAVA